MHHHSISPLPGAVDADDVAKSVRERRQWALVEKHRFRRLFGKNFWRQLFLFQNESVPEAVLTF